MLYQDLAEMGCFLGERVMFAQRFVNANCYVSAQGYSGGSAGRASPRARAPCAACLPAASGAPPRVRGGFGTALALYRGARRLRAHSRAAAAPAWGWLPGGEKSRVPGERAVGLAAPRSLHAPPRAPSSSVYPPLAPEEVLLLSPLPRMPALAPVTHLPKVGGTEAGLASQPPVFIIDCPYHRSERTPRPKYPGAGRDLLPLPTPFAQALSLPSGERAGTECPAAGPCLSLRAQATTPGAGGERRT